MGDLLLPDEDSPLIVVNEQGRSPFVLICEHASRLLPKRLGTLGLPAADLSRHIAWDIGAGSVARVLSRLIDAPLLMQRYSRLVYDCNRPPEAPDAIPEISETIAIPGNANLTADEKLARVRCIYRPFHDGVSALLDSRAAHNLKPLIISIHSFTPVFKGKARAVELGILHDRDARLSSKLIKGFPNVDARLNEPYGPWDGVLHSLNMHGFARGLQHAMLEIRNDLIDTERGQDEWAQRLSVPLIQAAAT
jgi:predicted N-formylglutamate amidohydrolase